MVFKSNNAQSPVVYRMVFKTSLKIYSFWLMSFIVWNFFPKTMGIIILFPVCSSDLIGPRRWGAQGGGLAWAAVKETAD